MRPRRAAGLVTASPGPRTGRLLLGRVGGVGGALVLGQVLVGLTYVLAARSMGPASLGLVATCFAIGTISSTVFDAGLTGHTVREVAAGRLGLSRARSYVRTKRRALPLLVAPTMAASVVIMPDDRVGVVLGLVGWAVWEAQTANALLRAQERFAPATSAQLGGRAAGLAATALLILAGSPELALAIGLVLSFAVEAVVDGVLLGRTGAAPVRVRALVAAHRRTLSFGLVALAGIGQQLDTPLVTAGGGAAAGGVYAGAGRLLGPLLFLSSSLALVGGPWLARAADDPAALRREERRIRRLSLVLAVGPLVAAVAGPWLIPLALGDDFAASGPTFAVLAVGAAFSTVNQGMATVLQNRGAERRVAGAIGLGLATGLVVTYVLAEVAGPVWAALGFTVSQLTIVAHLAWALRRTTRPVTTADR